MPRGPSILLSLGLLSGLVAAPAAVRADVGDELFVATILFEQAYLGDLRLDGGDLTVGSNETLGASLRVELLLSEWVGIGVEGSANYIRPGTGLVFLGPANPQLLAFEGRHLVAGTNAFVRVRFGLGNGRAEYYLIGGGGPAFMDYDPDDPNAYGFRIAGGGDLGYTAYARFGVRGELVPGFGALVEIGWLHREHQDAFTYSWPAPGGGAAVTPLDYVINQMSITVGWYFAR